MSIRYMYATCISCFYCLLKFLKRQDLLNVLARMMRPACDQVVRFHFFFSLRCILLQIHFLTSRVCGLVYVVILFWGVFFCSKSKWLLMMRTWILLYLLWAPRRPWPGFRRRCRTWWVSSSNWTCNFEIHCFYANTDSCSLNSLNFYQLCINIKIKALFLCIPFYFFYLFFSSEWVLWW